jgi:hypothetical protein
MTRSNMPCTICGRAHSASSCTSGISRSLNHSALASTASKSPSTKKPSPSTEENTGTTAADAQARLSRLCTECGDKIDAMKLASTNNSYCRECQKAYNREYYRTHKDKWGDTTRY